MRRRWQALAHSRLALAGSTVLVVLALLLMARQPLWAYHLSGDIGLYAQRARIFSASGSWAELGVDWFPPGALLFFLLPQAFFPLLSYTDALFLLNALLLVLHIVVLRKIGGPTSAWLGLVLFASAGPIGLFRFDLLVSLLTLLALLVWKRRKPLASGVLLGLGIGVKVYPICLLPFLLWGGGKRPWRWACFVVSGACLGIGVLLLAFLVAGGSVAAVARSLAYHVHKPVALQSTMGVLTLVAGGLQGHLPRPVNSAGIHGYPLPALAEQFAFAGLLGTLLLLFLAQVRSRSQAPIERFLAAATVSVLFWSTGLQPQYLLWMLGFMALRPLGDHRASQWTPAVALYGAALLAEQAHFPTHYTQFLNLLYIGEPHPVLLAVFLFGKALFLLLALLLVGEQLRPFRCVTPASQVL